MIKNSTGFELLKRNFDKVEAHFMTYFENQQPRWPSETRDYLRNHYQNLDQFVPSTLSWEKLRMSSLPEEILKETRAAFDAFSRGEEYQPI